MHVKGRIQGFETISVILYDGQPNKDKERYRVQWKLGLEQSNFEGYDLKGHTPINAK